MGITRGRTASAPRAPAAGPAVSAGPWRPADPVRRRLLATDLAAAQHEALTRAAEMLRDLRDAASEALAEVSAHLETIAPQEVRRG